MLRRPTLNATTVFLFMEMAMTLSTCLVFTVNSLYEVTVAGLTPLQLVLVGTALEISAFVFEVPTGVVADVYSRRLSIIIGYVLIGVGFLVEGLFPSFVPILLAQMLWGLGYTFTSGAREAWITDEVGEDSANRLFLRAARLSSFAWLLGLGLTVLIGTRNVAIPIRAGAIAIILTGIVLALIMPETGFRPAPQEDRNTWQHMLYVFKQGLQAVRLRPRLVNLLFVALFYGVYSEGYDRLRVKLLLDHFSLPVWLGSNQVAFFVGLEAIVTLLAIFAIRFVERRVNTSDPSAVGRALLFITGSITVAMVTFALAPVLALAVAAMILVDLLRNISGPLQTGWINQKLDPDTRATVHSMFGQVDAIGQIASGPMIGVIASAISVRLAVSLSGTLLSPALLFIARANRRSPPETPLPRVESAD
jgi:DHA3 family tetracycline resistance protein-like MFS transporter